MLTGPLPVWDLDRRRVDVTPLVEWIVRCAREVRALPPGVELSRLHDHVDAEGAVTLSHHLTLHSRAARPRAIMHALLRAAIPELSWRDVVVQCAAHVRFLIPGDTVSPVETHTDHAIGHGLEERNIWIALTPARATAALHVLPLAPSIDSELARKKGKTNRVDPDVASRTKPVDVHCGDVLLFTPVHVHGARVVREDATRVSVDVRIAPSATARCSAGLSFVPWEAP